MNTAQSIRRAQSVAEDPRIAAREFYAGVVQPEMALVVFFCSSEYDLDALADELNKLFGSTLVVGCTTAGEIGPAGYCSRSLAGASFSASDVTPAAGRIDHLQRFQITKGHDFAKQLLHTLTTRVPNVSGRNTFALLLIDGLSVREEPVIRAVQAAVGSIPVIGGSAGDDLRFKRTCVFHEGAFRSDSAVLLLVHTALPFKVFKTQHFVSGTERMVVTEADIGRRIVKEINGLPAAEEYARVAGFRPEALESASFATAPVVVMIDGTEYVRSIQRANPDGSLTFYCAIDEGLVLRVAQGRDLLENLELALEQLSQQIGRPSLIFGCDCILRSLEMDHGGLREQVGELLDRYNTVGFSTYGEQYGGVHINQTFTGIAIGEPTDHA